ncbi:unnamed protein product [Protopolystoma xenopodis]|uniref:Uncharacterized protein n=1 Tax=Protopolystoma xenopodis TaxID=117903 RepID=A0A3S5AWC9_9PLAT|nr:unnamed protein product [Protopolystoma xenopodis]
MLTGAPISNDPELKHLESDIFSTNSPEKGNGNISSDCSSADEIVCDSTSSFNLTSDGGKHILGIVCNALSCLFNLCQPLEVSSPLTNRPSNASGVLSESDWRFRHCTLLTEAVLCQLADCAFSLATFVDKYGCGFASHSESEGVLRPDFLRRLTQLYPDSKWLNSKGHPIDFTYTCYMDPLLDAELDEMAYLGPCKTG